MSVVGKLSVISEVVVVSVIYMCHDCSGKDCWSDFAVSCCRVGCCCQ